MTRLVLGSASAGRLKVLRQAGVDPVVVVSGVDEDAILSGLGSGVAPENAVAALAAAKAAAVADRLDPELSADCVVVGCDSMLLFDGRLRGKPDTVAMAREQWQSMAGRSGRLHTGHCLIRLQGGKVIANERQTVVTTVHFGIPSDADLQAYLDSGEPLRVAGGFTLDGLGGWFIDGVDGDPSSVIGLSLALLRSLLARVELSVADLWSA